MQLFSPFTICNVNNNCWLYIFFGFQLNGCEQQIIVARQMALVEGYTCVNVACEMLFITLHGDIAKISVISDKRFVAYAV
jgi:hypothetical protein